MSEFTVGDKVRIKDAAEADGWLQPGEVGEISQAVTGPTGGVSLVFERGDACSWYYGYEVEPYVEPEPVDHSAAIEAMEGELGRYDFGVDYDESIAEAEERLRALRERKAEHERRRASVLATIAFLKGEAGAAG